MENTVVRIQDKGSRFLLLTNEDCEEKSRTADLVLKEK